MEVLHTTPPPTPTKTNPPVLKKKRKKKINVLVLSKENNALHNHHWQLDIVNGVILHFVHHVECLKFIIVQI